MRAYFAARRRGCDQPRHDEPSALSQAVVAGSEQNEEMALAFDDHRRSTAFLKILQIHRRGLFTDEEFARFSEQTRKHVSDVEAM